MPMSLLSKMSERPFRAGCAKKASFPPKCCGRPLHIYIWSNLLDREVVERYEAIEEESNADRPLYCADQRCSAFIPENNQISDELRYCGDCAKLTCLSCRNEFSRHSLGEDRDRLICPVDDADLKALKDLGHQNKWKQCPKCLNLVERVDGCNDMECVCGADFCYSCGSHFDENDRCQCRFEAL
ncbi:hypothetical protein EDD36DRAFT_112941 [Exophiala viscosa]|uniref:IBR domain-containing protein n=1 Tax=Exophiala viscosa TaxID=2486360 RepID=A0AAN6DMI2_9EURO|nr:hypothetical protein EDD36DRAFT_112941 [Exophiala viscosa]